MAKAVTCSRCATVTSDETEEGLVANVQKHNRVEHRFLLTREQTQLLVRLHTWGERRRALDDANAAGNWLGAVRAH